MNICLIGASGFVGTRLIEILNRNSNFNLINIDKQKSYFFPKITHIANILDKEKIIQLLKGQDLVILLAAEHHDNVTPKSLYYDVNVKGMKNVLAAMDVNNIKRIIFTSSVAIYGLNKNNPSEETVADPFNDYGKSKYMAEKVLKEWYINHPYNNVNILRPTVIFGERNRGNVYNLLNQISSGHFLMIGKGNNKKSMAYVGNIVHFIQFLIENKNEGYNVYNYIDKPDLSMNDLVKHVSKILNKHIPSTHFPYWLGMLGGYSFDFISKLLGKKLTISSIRIKKFCATTQFDANKTLNSGYKPYYSLEEGLARTLKYEFIERQDINNKILDN